MIQLPVHSVFERVPERWHRILWHRRLAGVLTQAGGLGHRKVHTQAGGLGHTRCWARLIVLGAVFACLPAYGQPPPDYKGDCTDAGCHDAYSRRAVVHQPTETGACDACHEPAPTGDHRFEMLAEGAELCLECHDSFPGKVQHAPVTQGRCTTCHDPHGSEAPYLIRAETVAELCRGCHEQVTQDLKFLHGPVAAGTCTSCHNPHASDHAGMLIAEGANLCFKCHTAMQTRMTTRKNKHEPATEDCTTCHNPHGAQNRMNLNTTPPDLCVDCHDEIGDILDEAAYGHEAVTQGAACVNCHDPHASEVEFNLRKEPMALCLSCHDRALRSDNGRLINMAQHLKDNPDHHGPIRQKNCTACHKNIHGGEHFRLLMGEYPPQFYAPFEEKRYAFCFECHEPDMLRDERTEKLTNFRNGDRNLHYLHVNRKVKGRTCRACHDTHASKRPKHITDSVSFGGWQMPLHYEKTETGGSCLPGCHKRYRYDRNAAVVNIPE